MKNFFTAALFFFAVVVARAQMLGIGTNTPAFRLDVQGGSINTDSLYRIGGISVLSVQGVQNLFVGNGSGPSADFGSYNTGVGNGALRNLSGGYHNTATGYMALQSNTSGYQNSGHGSFALSLNTTGVSNVAVGYSALSYNTTGSGNVANGAYAMNYNTIGNYNTTSGYQALANNTTGSYNTAIGHQGLIYNTTGSYNTGIGNQALHGNTIGYDNVGVGRLALASNVSGAANVGLGNEALRTTTNSHGNTAVGYKSGDSYNNGYYNTFLGSDADATGDGFYNSIAIGNSSRVTAPVQVRIGASFIGSIGGYQNWTNISDGRFKKNISESVKGLDFIMKLRPVTYNLDISALSKLLNENRGDEMQKEMAKSIAEKEQVVFSGFVAQQVEQAAKETGYDFSGVDKPKNVNDLYGLRYAEFVVPLVKAIQEQQVLIRSLESRLELLERANRTLVQQANTGR